jgi:hypothetical protein
MKVGILPHADLPHILPNFRLAAIAFEIWL